MSFNRALFIRALALSVAGLCSLVIIGWLFDISILKSVVNGYITMKINTAITFIILSLALWVSTNNRPGKVRNGLMLFMASIILGISIATLSEYLFAVNLGLDEFFIQDKDAITGHFPAGRLAPITAINFILLAGSIVLQVVRFKGSKKLSQFLIVTCLVISVQGFLGYLMGSTYLFGSAFYTQMAIHTSVSFVVLTLGMLVAWHADGIGEILSSAYASAKMVRQLIFGVLIIPALVRWASQKGFSSGWYDQDFSVLLQVFASMIVLTALVLISTNTLLKAEKERLVLTRFNQLRGSRRKISVCQSDL